MEKATVQSIDRALSIVEALAGEKEGLGVTEISTRVGLLGQLQKPAQIGLRLGFELHLI